MKIYAKFRLALYVIIHLALFIETHLASRAHLAAHSFSCAQKAGFGGGKGKAVAGRIVFLFHAFEIAMFNDFSILRWQFRQHALDTSAQCLDGFMIRFGLGDVFGQFNRRFI